MGYFIFHDSGFRRSKETKFGADVLPAIEGQISAQILAFTGSRNPIVSCEGLQICAPANQIGEESSPGGRITAKALFATFIVNIVYDKSFGQSYAFVKVETHCDRPITISHSILDDLKARAALFPSDNSCVCCKVNVTHRARIPKLKPVFYSVPSSPEPRRPLDILLLPYSLSFSIPPARCRECVKYHHILTDFFCTLFTYG